MRSVAETAARFIGLTVFLYATWILIFSLAHGLNGADYDPLWTPWVIVSIALIGLIGSVAFLLSFDGPPGWRTRGKRFLGWSGMMFCALLPSQLIVIMAPLTALGLLALLLRPDHTRQGRGRHLVTSPSVLARGAGSGDPDPRARTQGSGP